MKKIFHILKTVFVWLVMLLAICMTVFTIVSLRTVNARDRNFFGYKAFIVQSDSMSRTDFSAGDIIFVKEVEPATLKEGDIIAFTSQNSHNFGDTVTHKIRSLVSHPNGEPGFITYGTTTDTDDEAVVTYSYVLGKYVGKITGIGVFFAFLKTPKGYVSIILIPFLLMIGYSLFNVIRLTQLAHKEEKQEQQAALEEERRKTEELRRELEELKAMLSKQTPESDPPPPKKSAPLPKETATTQQPPKPKPYDELDLENIVKEFSPTLNPRPTKKK